MICIICKREIERSYGLPGMNGCYCERCVKLTPEYITQGITQINDDIAITILANEIVRLKAENERLKEDNEILKMSRATIFEIGDAFDRGRKKGVSNTITKMQERLKAELNDCCRYIQGNREYFIVGEELIDKIAEELRKEIQDAAHR